MFTFERGNLNTLMLTVLRFSGSVPSFPGDYTNPEVRISHVNGNSEVEDLPFTSMSQFGTGSLVNRWFHKFIVPNDAAFTKYLATFKVTIDGIETYSTEEFRVAPTESEAGDGEFTVDLTFKGSSNQPLDGVVVTVYDKTNPTVVIAQAVSSEDGTVLLFLNEGEYVISAKKTGVISETHDLIVNSDGTHQVIGD